MKKPPNKKRSRRLNKKLHTGEFQVMGFEFEAWMTRRLSDEEHDDLVGKMLEKFILPRGLQMAPLSIYGSYICAQNRSVTEEERIACSLWLLYQPEVFNVRIHKLTDAYYPPDIEVCN